MIQIREPAFIVVDDSLCDRAVEVYTPSVLGGALLDEGVVQDIMRGINGLLR